MKQVSFWIVKLSLLSLLLGLSACASRQPDYLGAKTIPAVKVPEGLDDSRLGQIYRLPQQQIIQPTVFKTPFPPAIATQASEQQASLQQLDNKLWVLNDRSVATTWVQVTDFWLQRGVDLESTDVANAALQTRWFKETLQPGFSIRYRLSLERGFQDNTTEIHFSNQKRDDNNLTSEWTTFQGNVGDDRVHAQLMSANLVTQLVDGPSEVGDSFLAESISLPQKSALSIVNDDPVLRLNVATVRAYQALVKALSSEGFLTYDSDLAKGLLYFDQYAAGNQRRGFFGFLSAKQNPRDNNKSPYSVEEVVTHLPNNPGVNELFFGDEELVRDKQPRLANVPGFLLVIKPHDGSQLLYLRDGYGKVLEAEVAKNILDDIRLRLF
jgi:uncharacterized lipoprotein